MSCKKHEAVASAISSMAKCFYKLSDSSCALARQNQRSNWFCLEFSFVTFLCFKTKKSKNIILIKQPGEILTLKF